MASSPDLHEHFHKDSHDTEHHCLSTDMQEGALNHVVLVPLVAPAFLRVACEIVSLTEQSIQTLPHHLCGSLLVHGPPVFA